VKHIYRYWKVNWKGKPMAVLSFTKAPDFRSRIKSFLRNLLTRINHNPSKTNHIPPKKDVL